MQIRTRLALFFVAGVRDLLDGLGITDEVSVSSAEHMRSMFWRQARFCSYFTAG